MQDQTDITESYTAEQTTIITLLNDQPRSQNILIQIAPQSQYLLSYVDIEDTTLTLIPGEKKNVLITTQLPEEGLSPETHIIDIIARSDDDKSVAKTKILFDVPGVANPSLQIISQEFQLEGLEKILSFELENDGNVIMRPKPEIQILQEETTIKTIEYKTPIQIMPGRSYPLSMRLDANSLEEGTYTVKVQFTDRDDITIESESKEFKINNNAFTPSSITLANFTTPLLIAGVFIILIIGLFTVNKIQKQREEPLIRQIRTIEKREKKLNAELEKLIKETHQTVNQANKWIKKNLGEEHELR